MNSLERKLSRTPEISSASMEELARTFDTYWTRPGTPLLAWRQHGSQLSTAQKPNSKYTRAVCSPLFSMGHNPGAWQSTTCSGCLRSTLLVSEGKKSTETSGEGTSPARNSSTKATRKTCGSWSQGGAGDRSAMCSGKELQSVGRLKGRGKGVAKTIMAQNSRGRDESSWSQLGHHREIGQGQDCVEDLRCCPKRQ